jgi:hypothetical protein
VWRKLFQALWKSFNAEFSTILRNLRSHRDLIESQITITQFSELVKTRESVTEILKKVGDHETQRVNDFNLLLAENLNIQKQFQDALQTDKDNETQRCRYVTRQWLSAGNYEADQETYSNVRKGYPGTGQWLMEFDKFKAWFNPSSCITPLLWLSGIPGAGWCP